MSSLKFDTSSRKTARGTSGRPERGLASGQLKVDTPVQFVRGVGPKLGEKLKDKGVWTVQDLLEWYPRAYEDRRAARSVDSLQAGELVSLRAEVVGVTSFAMGKSRRKIWDVVVRDATGKIHCKYFRVPYKGYFERFQPNQKVRVIGRVINYRGRIEFHHPDLQDDAPETYADDDVIVPIYPETDGITNRQLRKMIQDALAGIAPHQDQLELLPPWMRTSCDLLPRYQALLNAHRPSKDSGPELAEFKTPAHRRLIFEEFFWLELWLASRKQEVSREVGIKMRRDLKLVNALRARLPFELTGAQERAFQEILNDLCDPEPTGPKHSIHPIPPIHPMHRLVQGDVGSGKTMVALMSALVAIASGYQATLMVPTEILAEQHDQTARRLLEPLGLKVGLLTGSLKARERAQALALLERGEIHLLIGTHALIEDTVQFKDLGLVIIDEQHRFGVQQRARLKNKGSSPHFLIMTATPIPRTLAMTVYGDLDVSVIDELPKGRSPIQTRVGFESNRGKMLEFVRAQITKGRQAYFVYPLVEESEKIDLKNAVTAFDELRQHFPEYQLGLLHGRMKPDEKDQVMRRFRAGEFQILVATTVIEVGVDVPNANVMVIEHSERFGLSQLHQLRGRVGRGEHKSFCLLMLGYAVSEEARDRVKIMEESTDGFVIAERDLELRGPGEFLGARQSGLPGFKLANLVRDARILQAARDAAFEVFRRDPSLRLTEHAALRRELLRAHGPTSLAGIG